MKYLKYFEKKNKVEIWKVPTREPYFTKAKIKIGAKNSFNWMSDLKNNEEYILLHYSDNFPGGKDRNDNWTHSGVDATDFSDGTFGNGKYIDTPEYMGEVELSKEDMERYKIEKETNKFNI